MNSKWTLMNYRELKKQIKNAVNELGTVLELKGVVANTSKLPLTGNKKGDVYIVSEDNTEYVWTSDNASGLITDYEELGPVIIGKPFIVTLTPTAADYSGTMDKTVAEINAAYEAGQHIVFRTMMSATTYMDVDCTARWFGGSTYPSFNGFILSSDNGGTLIFAFTGATDDGTRATYGANIYTLSYPSANGVNF